MPSLHQFVAGFRQYDAISDEALLMRRIFRGWGYASDIFAQPSRIAPERQREAGDVAEFARRCSPDDNVLLHLSIGADINDVFARLPCRKLILYHNITPPSYFRVVDPAAARALERGRRQARALATAATVTMADSAFNASELAEMGYSDVKVLPLLAESATQPAAADRRTLAAFGDGMVNVLFVGRCAPNKRIEHALQAFLFFQKAMGRPTRFIHAGSTAGLERYLYMLTALVRDIGIENVVFTGPVTQAGLNALYQRADLFLCMSEHEGFCVPILEAMAHDVPVVARAAGAVPETMDGAGILCGDLHFKAIAEMMCRLTTDRDLRSAVTNRQRQRMRSYADRDLESELRARLQPVLE